jgi:hypothetical protein
MSFRSVLSVVFGFVLACMAFLPVARADVWNQATKLTFSEPIELPGVVLPAGSYWFVLGDSASNRNLVEVFSQDWSEEFANLITIPSYRQQPTNETEVKFAEPRHGGPESLLKWYYPGLLEGHEFLYSARQEHQLARDVKQDVIAPALTTRP